MRKLLLVLAILVVAGRLLLGTLLGSLAGWLSGSWFDRALLGLAEVLDEDALQIERALAQGAPVRSRYATRVLATYDELRAQEL